MSAVARICAEWMEEDEIEPPFHQDDIEEAFVEGWNRAMMATWEPGGQPAHPKAPRKVFVVAYYEQLYGVCLTRPAADELAAKHQAVVAEVDLIL